MRWTSRPRCVRRLTACALVFRGHLLTCRIVGGGESDGGQGWSGGDRLAIHGSPTPTWGLAVSNGCLHADEADLQYLMRTVPLGTAVRIHA